MLRYLSKGISIIFHPLFILGYILFIIRWTNPYLMSFPSEKAMVLTFLSILVLVVFFPLLSIIMMKLLGLVKSLELESKEERIAPIIITGLFYMWLFINIRQNNFIPSYFTCFVLGATIATFLSLVLNIFIKISLHTVAAGGFATMQIIILNNLTWHGYGMVFQFSDYLITISILTATIGVIIICGMIGAARLYLRAHTSEEVYLGYAVGVLSQFLAMNFYTL